MEQLMPKSTAIFQTAVYNSFIKIINRLVDLGITTQSEGIQLIKKTGVVGEGKDYILDVTVRKNVFQTYNEFKEILDDAEFPYEKIIELIEEEERLIRQKQHNDELEKSKQMYGHLKTAARQIFGYQDKLDLANKFWVIQPFFYDESKIWWLWDKKDHMWNIIDEVDLFNALDSALESDLSLRTRHKTEVKEALRRVGRGRMPKPIKKTMIQFRGNIYDLETDEVIDATPDLFATNPIPHNIGLSDETPTIDRIFKEWVGEEYVPVLHEVLAYCMLPDYPLHRIFCLVGSGMNGKGKFLELVSRFIGEKNKTSTELDYLLNSRFEAAKLYKKLVCLMGETNFTELSKTSLLKRLSGGDTIGFEFKNKDPFDDYNYAKIIIATNSLPVTTDKTRGFYRRWLLVDFPNEFTEKKDILAEIPQEEFQSLAKKCIGILKNILKERIFTNEGSIEERMKRYEERSNPVAQFIKERCVQDPAYKEPLFKFYDELKVYLRQRGHRDLSKREVTRILRNDGIDIDKKHVQVPAPGGGMKDTKWNYVFGLQMMQKDNLEHYEKQSGPEGPNGPQISTYSPIRNLSGNQGPTSPKGPVSDIKTKQIYKIYHKCVSCGNIPSHTYTSDGSPICEDCLKKMSENSILVDVETVKD